MWVYILGIVEDKEEEGVSVVVEIPKDVDDVVVGVEVVSEVGAVSVVVA